MICCLNPDCPNPINPDGTQYCQSCRTKMIRLLRGRFRVIKPLGQGGFGRTYLAEDEDKLKERSVVKQLFFSLFRRRRTNLFYKKMGGIDIAFFSFGMVKINLRIARF